MAFSALCRECVATVAPEGLVRILTRPLAKGFQNTFALIKCQLVFKYDNT